MLDGGREGTMCGWEVVCVEGGREGMCGSLGGGLCVCRECGYVEVMQCPLPSIPR